MVELAALGWKTSGATPASSLWPPTSCLQPPTSNLRLDRIDDARHFAGPEKRIDLGDVLRELVAVALRETAGHDETRALAVTLVLGHLQDRVDRFLLGVVDEGAGVHDDDVGIRGVRRELVPGLLREPQHHLAVDEVFRAAE